MSVATKRLTSLVPAACDLRVVPVNVDADLSLPSDDTRCMSSDTASQDFPETHEARFSLTQEQRQAWGTTLLGINGLFVVSERAHRPEM
jgi:hypothetical protein